MRHFTPSGQCVISRVCTARSPVVFVTLHLCVRNCVYVAPNVTHIPLLSLLPICSLYNTCLPVPWLGEAHIVEIFI